MRIARNRLKFAVAVGIIVLAVIPLLIGVCRRLDNLGDKKADHEFVLPGSDPITDAQAISFAQEVLVLDQRNTTNLVIEDNSGAAKPYANRNTNEPVVTVRYRDVKTNWVWFVTLERQDGKLVGFSTHGL